MNGIKFECKIPGIEGENNCVSDTVLSIMHSCSGIISVSIIIVFQVSDMDLTFSLLGSKEALFCIKNAFKNFFYKYRLHLECCVRRVN